jgi:hypothetical protein
MWNVKRISLVIIQFLKAVRQSLTIVIYLIIFFLGFTVGFFVSQTFYKQADITGWVLAITTWIILASGMFGLFYAILKDKREREQIPKLEFETISLCKSDTTYFLRVKKNEKAITACIGANGLITVEGTTVQDARAVWAHENRKYDDISIRGDLRLFRVQNKESIFFYSAASNSSEMPFLETEPKSYNEFMNKFLIVQIGSSNAPIFKHKGTIRDIISSAV